MRNRVFLATGLIVAFGSLAYPVCGVAQPIDIESIREHLRQQWESIESIEWTLDECLVRNDGVALPSPACIRFEMSRSKGGLSFYKSENTVEGHESVVFHMLEDGKRRYTYTHLNDYPGVIHELDITAQQTFDEGLDDIPQNSITWLTTPSGQPLYMHMTSEARAQEIDEDGRKLIEVVFPSRGSTLRCLLDPERDWSAVSMEFQDAERTKWEVTKFQRDNGRWFASEGLFTGKILAKFQEYTFKVSNLKINRPVAPGTYDQARLPSGALVVDRIKNTKRVWNGTNKTRNEFLSRYPSKRKPPSADRNPSADPGLARSGRLCLVLCARSARLREFLALAGILKLRRGQA